MCFEKARAWVNQASSIAILTGAGISAESGIPTFRGAAGLWKQFRAEDLATPDAFSRDPELIWEWYAWRRSLISQAQPNPGHLALAELERRTPRFALITQNVDGLHQRAGSRNILEVHGSIWKLRCTKCSREWHDQAVPLILPPHCECERSRARALSGSAKVCRATCGYPPKPQQRDPMCSWPLARPPSYIRPPVSSTWRARLARRSSK
jgi:NAD-dependent SIR2 family protein deacetylase